MNRSFALVCLVVLSAAVVAGCGGPSKEEYAQQANGICSQIQKDLQAVSQGGQTNDPEEINKRTDQAVDAFSKGVNKIQGLEKPSGDAGKQAEQFEQAFQDFLKNDYQPGVEKLQKAVSSKDRQQIRSAALQLRNINTQDVNRLATQLGVTECASGA
jgi:hypothetical protein